MIVFYRRFELATAMSALGLAGYSSSESDDENIKVEIRENPSKASLASASKVAPAAEQFRSRTSEAVPGEGFGGFGRARKQLKYTRRGLPVFSKPVAVDNESDSDDEARMLCCVLHIIESLQACPQLHIVGFFRLNATNANGLAWLARRGSRFCQSQSTHYQHMARNKKNQQSG